MKSLLFFDSNAMIGQPMFDPESGRNTRYTDRAALLSSMDRSGVELALVSHWRGLKGDVLAANERLLSEIGGSPRLYPCLTVLPECVQDAASRVRLSDQIKATDARAVRVPFGESTLCAAPWALSELFGFLEQKRLLVILQYPYLGVAVPERDDPYLEALDKLLSDFPRLRVVTLGRLRGFYPLMARHENLFTSLAWDPYPDFVEDVTRRFGSGRILFGTPYCENAKDIPGMPMMMVAHAAISEEDKAAVAGANLARLLGTAHVEESPCLEKSAFRNTLRPGGISFPVTDVHTHVGAWIADYKPAYGAEELIRETRAFGPSAIYINSTEAVVGGDHVRGNAEIADTVRARPDVLRGIYVFNPEFEGGATALRQAVTSDGFSGIKVHPRMHRCAVTDARLAPVWEAAESLGVPVLCHTGQGQAFSEPDQFAEIAPRHPKARIIMAHTGETFAGMEQCVRLLNRFENLYVDVSGWLFMKRGMLEYLVRRVDRARILYGSDYSWIDVRYALATVLFADIDEETRRMIFSANAARVFGH